MNKWAICAVVCGAICLVFGIIFLYGVISDPGADMFFVKLITGLLGTAGGACGIAGGLCIKNRKDTARKLLLAAAVILLPYAILFVPFIPGVFVFFMIFMVVRNRAADKEDAWGEKEVL